MEKNIKKWVLLFVCAILLLAFLFPAQKKIYNLHQCSFNTQQSTTLFFKNTRAFYYAASDLLEAGFTVYRYGKCTRVDTGIYLNFILVHNWRANQVYIATEPSRTLLAHGPIEILVGDSTVKFDKSRMNNEDQYQFAALVFEALLGKKPISLAKNGKNIFGNAANAKANQTVLEDYFRWVYKYR